MSKKAAMPELFAFWRYDLFPYVLGGKVVQMDEKGRVQTSNYGPGNWFKPIKLLPVKAGEKLMNELERLREEKREEQRQLDKIFLLQVHALLPEATRNKHHLEEKDK